MSARNLSRPPRCNVEPSPGWRRRIAAVAARRGGVVGLLVVGLHGYGDKRHRNRVQRQRRGVSRGTEAATGSISRRRQPTTGPTFASPGTSAERWDRSLSTARRTR
jgi:hypothetical protein